MNYSNAKIYRIVCNETGEQYIGSTTQSLSQRLSEHKSKYKRYLNKIQHYTTSFEIIKKNNYDIILIEELKDCQNKDQLHKRERYYIENMDCVNKCIPTRTGKEYNKELKDVIANKQKEYYKNNKGIILNYKKEYYEAHKECILNKRKGNYENNKQLIINKQKEYYVNNKQLFNAKCNCECGGKYTYTNKPQHLKTNLHQQFLEGINNLTFN